jgi:hypothetical protein
MSLGGLRIGVFFFLKHTLELTLPRRY